MDSLSALAKAPQSPSLADDRQGSPRGSVEFHPPAVLSERLANGVHLLRSPRQLEPYPDSIIHWLERWARERPRQAVLAARDANRAWRTLAYEDAWLQVRCLATSLLELGASQDRPLAILSGNSIEQALLTWAAHLAGVPVAPVSPAYSLTEGALGRLQAVCRLIDPWLVFAQDGRQYARAIDALGVPRERVIAVRNLGKGMLDFAQMQASESPQRLGRAREGFDPDAAAKYMFTSGSTGVPKGVVMSHRMLSAALQGTAQAIAAVPQRPMVQVDWLPWHHTMGGNVVLGRLLRFGGTLYLDDGKPLPGHFDRTLANLRDVAPTFYFNVPAGYGMLVAELERDAAFARHMLSQLDFAYFAGASLPAAVHQRLQAVSRRTVGRELTIGTAYAATETTAAILMRAWPASQASCIGLPLPGAEIKLVPDSTAPGRYEIRVRGPGVFKTYLRAPQAVSESFDDEGFYKPGDAVSFVDEADPSQGLLFAGRFAEDFKLANGTWVRAAAVRARLLATCAPLIREAVVVGEGRDAVGCLVWLTVDSHANREQVRMRLAEGLARINKGQAAATSRIEALIVLSEPPSSEHYELTDKGSVNARAVTSRRAEQVEALYAQPRPGDVITAAEATRGA